MNSVYEYILFLVSSVNGGISSIIDVHLNTSTIKYTKANKLIRISNQVSILNKNMSFEKRKEKMRNLNLLFENESYLLDVFFVLFFFFLFLKSDLSIFLLFVLFFFTSAFFLFL